MTYQRVAQSPALGAEAVGLLYGVPAEAVTVIPYPAGRAIKIVFRRVAFMAGDPGDVLTLLWRTAARAVAGDRAMSASGRILAEIRRRRRTAAPGWERRASSAMASRTPGFTAGLAKGPDLIGCDMGSIDIGPTYLGKGEMATAPEATRRDLRKVLLAARELDVPLVIGSAGSAGAAPHLDATLALIRDIARKDGLRFRMAVIRADVARPVLLEASRAGRIASFDDMPELTEDDITGAAHIVGQMGHRRVPPRTGGGCRCRHRRQSLRHRYLCRIADAAGLPRRACHAHGENHRVCLAMLRPRRP